MHPMISQRWQIALDGYWRNLVQIVTGRVVWPRSKFLVNDHYRFIYCPIAKVACTSFKLWMLEVAGDTPPAPFNEQVEVQRYSLRRLGHRAACRLLADDEYFRFAFVRNPWSRVVSAYLNKFQSVNVVSQPVLQKLRPKAGEDLGADVSFREFVEYLGASNPIHFDEHWRPQHLFVKDVSLDFLGRFEHLARDFAWVQERLGIATPLPHNNVTSYAPPAVDQEGIADRTAKQMKKLGAFPDYRRFYTPRLRDLVARIYAGDIKQFGYAFDS